MKRTYSFTALTLAGLMGLGTITAPLAAGASEEGKRNTAIGLGAAAAALLLTQHNKVPGILAAGGALIAASQLDNDHRRYGDDRRDYDRDRDRDRRDYDRDRDRNRDHRDNDGDRRHGR